MACQAMLAGSPSHLHVAEMAGAGAPPSCQPSPHRTPATARPSSHRCHLAVPSTALPAASVPRRCGVRRSQVGVSLVARNSRGRALSWGGEGPRNPLWQHLQLQSHALLPQAQLGVESQADAQAEAEEEEAIRYAALETWLMERAEMSAPGALSLSVKPGRAEGLLRLGLVRQQGQNAEGGEGAAGVGGESEYGLIATRDLNSGDDVALIPEAVLLSLDAISTAAAASGSPAAPAVVLDSLRGELKPWVQLALFLLVERERGQYSDWGPYIATLPRCPNSPLFWSEDELQELAGSQLLGSVEQYKEYVEAEYAAAMQVLSATPSAGSFPWQSVVTLESFTWAFGVLRSRCFPPFTRENIALVPMLDLVNHGRAPEAAAWVRKSSGGGGLFGMGRGKAQNCVSMAAGQSYKAGDQIVMDYGQSKSNGDLLLDFGFVDIPQLAARPTSEAAAKPGGRLSWMVGEAASGSPEARREAEASAEANVPRWQRPQREVFSLTLEVPASDRFLDDKLDIAELQGLTAPAVTFDLAAGEALPENFVPYLRLIALAGSDAFLLEPLFRNAVWGHLQLPVSRENEEAVCRAMIDGCGDALAGYPTTITQDVRLAAELAATEFGSRRHMAVVVRLGEKRVLAQTQALFEQRLLELDELEYYAERRLRDLGLLDDKGDMTPWAFAE